MYPISCTGRRFFGTVLLFFLFVVCESQAHAAGATSSDPTLYLGKVRVRLCPQYLQGTAGIELDYRIGSNPTRYPLNIVSTQIDAQRGEGSFQFYLPRTLGTLKMHIEAHCVNAVGRSRPSNAISVSNCDFLAGEDNDADGMPNSMEDLNCDNFFSPGDLSNPDNVDTDGDGVRDMVEYYAGTDPH